MKTLSAFSGALLLLLIMTAMTYGANTTTQNITVDIGQINELRFSDNPAPLIVSTATAGSQPTLVSNTVTRYYISTNGTSLKITASLNQAVPTSTTLQISLNAPTGGSSAGYQTMTVTPVTLVTNITRIAASNLRVNYRFSATVDAGVVPSTTRSITFTLTN